MLIAFSQWIHSTALSFQRLAVGSLCLAAAVVATNLALSDIKGFFLQIPVMIVGGIWIGRATKTRKDGFAGGLLFGWGGYWLGLLILFQIESALQSGGVLGALLGLLAGFLAGLFVGAVPGIVGGFAGYVGARWRGKLG
jgi:hypothetical protein